MSQMQLFVGAALPSVFYFAPVAAAAAIGVAMSLRGAAAGGAARRSMTGPMVGAVVAMALVFAARAIGGETAIANALVLGGVAGSVLAFVVFLVLSWIAARGSARGVALASVGFAVFGVSLWTWLLAAMGERFGLTAGDWTRITVTLLGSGIGSACVALGASGAADGRVASGMQAYATLRGILVAAAAIGVCAAQGLGDLADGEKRQLAVRLVVSVLGVGGAAAAASVIGIGAMKGAGLRGVLVTAALAAGVAFGGVWLGMQDELAVSAVKVALAVALGVAAAVVMAWREDAGSVVLAAGAAGGWLLLRTDESEALGLFGVALTGLGFAAVAGASLVRGGEEGSRAADGRGHALAASAVAGLVLAAAGAQMMRVQQSVVAETLGRAYPRTNYKDGTFVGKVDIAGPHGVYVGNAMLAMIFPGAGANHSTVYDAGMIDRSRLQEHLLETLSVGMIFPLSAPGAEDHGHEDHAEHEHDHAHDDGGHDHDPGAARERVLQMTGEVPHGDHSHSYTQDVIASRHATLSDVLAFHGGSPADGRLLAGLLAGLGLGVCVGRRRMAGAVLDVGVALFAVLVGVSLGLGGVCGLVAGVSLAAAGAGLTAGRERSAALGSAVLVTAFAGVVLGAVMVRMGPLVG